MADLTTRDVERMISDLEALLRDLRKKGIDDTRPGVQVAGGNADAHLQDSIATLRGLAGVLGRFDDPPPPETDPRSRRLAV